MPSALSDLCVLRESIARIEALEPGGNDRTPGPATGKDAIGLGDEALALDALLGGGLRRGTLHEIVAESARHEASASAFALALAARCAAGGTLVWVMDDRAAFETGTPYRPGLAAHGIAADRLVLVRTRDAQATLWATEEALRAGARVVVTELWRARGYDLAASRRLLLASRRSGATNLLIPVGLGQGDALSSAADTRFAVAACPSTQGVRAGGRLPLPGLPGFAVRLVKLRGAAAGVARGFDRDKVHTLAWDRRAGCFRAIETLRQPWPARLPPGWADPAFAGEVAGAGLAQGGAA